jgi:ABC-type transport system involved in cytochrome c biogenesis permease subunit
LLSLTGTIVDKFNSGALEVSGEGYLAIDARFSYILSFVSAHSAQFRMDMGAAVDIFVTLMPVLYAGLVALYAISFFGRNPTADSLRSPLLVATAGLHVLYIVLRTLAFDHAPITTVFEIMTMLAACICIGYAYIEVRTGTSSTGFFILLLALVFQTFSSLYIKDLTEIAPVLRSRLLGFHVSAALLGYTAISLSAVYGFLYLMLYHEIKSSRFGAIYNRLPNLEMLEKMSHKSELFGFLMLSLAIIIGILWLPRAFESFSYWDPKLIGSVVIWILYAFALAAKRMFGLQGRKTMILSLVGFGFVFLSMTVINLFMSSFHGFY